MTAAVWAASAERKPPAQKNRNRFILGEDCLVIGAFWVDPELQHAARTMEGPGYPAFTVEFANIADVDEDDLVAAVQR